MLTLEAIAGASDRPLVRVDLPEWGKQPDGSPACLWVARLTPGRRTERDIAWAAWVDAMLTPAEKLLRLSESPKAAAAWKCLNIAAAACDAEGNSAFADIAAAADVLGRKSDEPISRLWEAMASANNLRQADNEEAAKNSDSSPSGSSA